MNFPLARRSPSHSGQFFGIGVTVGVFVGLVVGSVLTSQLGEAAVHALKGLFERLAGRRERVNFELLLQ